MSERDHLHPPDSGNAIPYQYDYSHGSSQPTAMKSWNHSGDSFQAYSSVPGNIEGDSIPLRQYSSSPGTRHPDATVRSSAKWKKKTSKTFKATSAIIGFWVAGLACAIAHLCFFKALDGDLVDFEALKQSHVNAISLILVMLFKAALTGCVGVCFAQHLWYYLRGTPTPVSTVEKLFVLRTNLLAFGDLRIIFRAPALFAMALFVWCLGIALIYPPGAITIVLEPATVVENRNLSVLMPPVPSTFNPFLTNPELEYAGLGPSGSAGCSISGPELEGQSWDNCTFTYYFSYAGEDILNIAQTTLNYNPGYPSMSTTGEDSSYTLDFRAPQFRCQISRNESAERYEPPFASTVFESDWDDFGDNPNFTVIRQSADDWFTATSEEEPSEVETILRTELLVCQPYSVRYKLNVTNPKGVQTFRYDIDDWKPLSRPDFPSYQTNNTLPSFKMNKTEDDMDSYPEAAKLFIQKVQDQLPSYNEWAILDSLLKHILREKSHLVTPIQCNEKKTLDNGTSVFNCAMYRPDTSCLKTSDHMWDNGLEGTVFDQQRFNTTKKFDNDTMLGGTSVFITEGQLNEALTNITVSALSLGTWWQDTPVTFLRNRNVWRFSRPLNLILPYAVSLAMSLAFSIISLRSLWENGFSAADHSFAQVMIATKDTQLTRMVAQEGCTSVDNMSENLKGLKVRYGQIVTGPQDGTSETQKGFGTVNETIPLKKSTG